METAQEVFNASYNGVLKQGTYCGIPKKTYNSFGTEEFVDCRYELKDGEGSTLHCAVGLLMNPIELEYFGDFQGDIEDLVGEYGRDLRPVFKMHSALLGEIQSAHDSAAGRSLRGEADFIEEFKNEMRRVADRYELEVPTDEEV